MEAQLLHIQSEDHKIWRLAGCIPLAPAHNISSDAKCLYEKTYMPGVLDLLSRTLADGGPCVGWYVRLIPLFVVLKIRVH